MLDLEISALADEVLRKAVLYPKADLLGPHLRELELLAQAERRNRRRGPAAWVGTGLVGIGERLTALGEWLAARAGDATPAS